MTLPATDNFTAADGTVLTTYSANWTADRNNFVVNTNALAPNSSFAQCCAKWNADAFNNDQYAKATVAGMDLTSTIRMGVCVREASGNFYGFTVTTGSRKLYVLNAGAETVLGSDTVSCAVNDVLRLVAAGTTITAYVNDVSIFSVTDAALGSGSAGVAGEGHFTGLTTQRIDNWEGGNGTGASSGTTYTDTGSATSTSAASGADVAILSDTGSAISVLAGSGIGVATLADTGSATSILTGSGAGVAVLADTATAVSILTGSGSDAPIYADTGNAISSAAGSGADTAILNDLGIGIAALFGAGTDVIVMVDVGGGVLVAIGSGTDSEPPPAELPYQGDAYIYDMASGIGSVVGGSIQMGPNQDSATGSVTGGTVLPAPQQDSPTGTVTGGTILASDTIYD